MELSNLPCCAGYSFIFAGNPPETIRQHRPDCFTVKLDKPDAMICPSCFTLYDLWVWEEDDSGAEWIWDGEWWHGGVNDFTCSKRCHLMAKGYKWSLDTNKWELP